MLKKLNDETHLELHGKIHEEVGIGLLSDVQISTLLNVNREFYLSNQNLLEALAEALLDADRAADFESIPTGL